MSKKRIAVVVPGFEYGGGVPVVAEFIYQTIMNSDRYEADLISLAVSAKDTASVRLLSPSSWLRGPQMLSGFDRDKSFLRVGCNLAEFEFQRYLPRTALTRLLNRYDLIQIVAGTPAWAMIAKHVEPPVLLQVATLARLERRARLAESCGLAKLHYRFMTGIVSQMDKAALRFVDAVFVENELMLRFLCKRISPSKVVFAPPGIDAEIFHPASTRKNGYVLSVGRFSDPRKNVRMMFDAYSRLLRSNPNAPRLVLAGRTGPSEADWRFADSIGVADRIEFKGDVTDLELAEIYRGASLFMLSSNEEGLGLVLLEAMASGLPVVSSKCGGPETAIIDGENGYLIPVGDSAALAAKAGEILNDRPLAEKMGKAGRRIVEKRFSSSVAGKVYLERYDGFFNQEDHEVRAFVNLPDIQRYI